MIITGSPKEKVHQQTHTPDERTKATAFVFDDEDDFCENQTIRP